MKGSYRENDTTKKIKNCQILSAAVEHLAGGLHLKTMHIVTLKSP
jgi:hypothetical protein